MVRLNNPSGDGVDSLNNLTGDVILAAGTGISITPSGQTLTIAATAAGGVTSVSNSDGTLTISPTTGAVVASRPAITGDISIAGGSNTSVLTTVNSNVGSFTNASITVNAKGLITAASSGTAPVTSVSGTTNRITSTGGTTPVIDISAAYVGQSSITTLGTITTGIWNGTTIAIANGGTGQTTANAAFNALSPMTTGGDIIYGGASGAGTRLANGTNGQVLTSAGGTSAPTWTTPTTGTVTGTGTANTMTKFTGTSAIGNASMTDDGTTVTNTLRNVNSFTSIASNPAMFYTGSWATGTGTTAFPHVYLQATGTTASTTLSTAGTAFGANAVTGFTGNYYDFMLAGVSKAKLTSAGNATFAGTLNVSGNATMSTIGCDVITCVSGSSSSFRQTNAGGVAGYDFIQFNNSSTADTTTTGANLSYYLRQNGGSTIFAGKVMVLGETNWTNNANTNAFMAFHTTNNAVGAERWRISSLGYLSNTGATGTAGLTLSGSTTTRSAMNMVAGTAPTSPIEGDMWADTTQKTMIMFNDGIKQAASTNLFTQTADKSVTNTVTETSIVGTGVGGLTLPANFFVAGKTIRIQISGVYSTVAVTGDTITIKIKYGSTVIGSVATTSLLAGASNLFFWGEALITCRSTGASGSVQISGGITYNISTVGGLAEDAINNGAATTTLDTTASGLLDVTVTHSAANASNSVKSLVSNFEVLN